MGPLELKIESNNLEMYWVIQYTGGFSDGGIFSRYL
eukprot:SAG11_NODE_12823_length_683_cov_1.154110_1_plen_35_part_01